mgnify:CR=1 FL=1|jgi:hypothetical protein
MDWQSAVLVGFQQDIQKVVTVNFTISIELNQLKNSARLSTNNPFEFEYG